MTSNVAVLDIFLHDQLIGNITHLPGDRNVVSFLQEYIDNPHRNTLSLSLRDDFGGLITDIKSTRSKLPTFFSNLLPEGPMRDFLASHAHVNAQREFYLLAALGQDLPGALKVLPSTASWSQSKDKELKAATETKRNEAILRFSLAGVQLKFSAVMDKNKGLTIPANGIGGSWIVKFPSPIYPGVPENEFAMMELAKQMGIDVPNTALVPIDAIKGLPKEMQFLSSHAYIIERFDRTKEGKGVHIEDFAQVFDVYPEKKYSVASFRNIVEVIWAETGEKGLIEFIRRFVFNALIGNGDMHLKNWSLIYPDKKKAALAPAYDFVSTLPYIPHDQLALSFAGSKAFSDLTYERLNRFAEKSGIPEKIVLETTKETVQRFMELWKSIHDFSIDKAVIKAINKHLKTIPLVKQT